MHAYIINVYEGFQFQNGHLICGDCHAAVETCPVCRVVLSKPGARNLLAEQMMATMSIRCRNYASGCVFEGVGKDAVNKHLADCQFRQVKCVVAGCEDAVPIGSILKHLKEKHKVRT